MKHLITLFLGLLLGLSLWGQAGRVKTLLDTIDGQQILVNSISKEKIDFEVPSATRNLNFDQFSGTFNSEFIVMLSGILSVKNSYVLNDTIEWEFLKANTNHDFIFVDTIYPTNQGQLIIGYPAVKRVLYLHVTPDETFAGNGIHCGPSVGLQTTTIVMSRPGESGIRLVGDGAGGWVQFPNAFALDLTPYSSGSSFNYASGLADYNTADINYVGANNYRIRRLFSGLGIYNARFVMVDNVTNTDIASNSTADVVMITGGTAGQQQVGAFRWKPTNQFLDGFSNMWLSGIMEAWMIAKPISTSSIKIRWQTDYPNATTYKLYRDVNPDFSTKVLIHTGNSGDFNDTNLSVNTLYYYQLVGVIAGSDIVITTFSTSTEAF